MGFAAACTSITLTAGTNIYVVGDVSLRATNDFKARWLAGDTLLVVPIKKMQRELKLRCYVAAFTTINTLHTVLVTPEQWTFTITDQASTALTADGTNPLKGYLKTVDHKFDGVRYDVELTWVVST